MFSVGSCHSSIALVGPEVISAAAWRRWLCRGCGCAWLSAPMGIQLALVQNGFMILPSHLLEAAGLHRQIDLAVREVFVVFQMAVLRLLHMQLY